MYARVTTYHVDPARLDEMDAELSDLRAHCKALPGILVYNTVWREDGRGISTTIYDCRASAEEAAVKLRYIWGSFSKLLIEEPVTELFDRTADMLETKKKIRLRR